MSSTDAGTFNYSLEIFPFLKQTLTSNKSILAHKNTLFKFVLI